MQQLQLQIPKQIRLQIQLQHQIQIQQDHYCNYNAQLQQQVEDLITEVS